MPDNLALRMRLKPSTRSVGQEHLVGQKNYPSYGGGQPPVLHDYSGPQESVERPSPLPSLERPSMPFGPSMPLFDPINVSNTLAEAKLLGVTWPLLLGEIHRLGKFKQGLSSAQKVVRSS